MSVNGPERHFGWFYVFILNLCRKRKPGGRILQYSIDSFPLQVKPFQTRYNLFNFAPYTKSHCECDQMFYNCLKAVNSSKADAVGDVFFNVLGIQCVEERLGGRGCVQSNKARARDENTGSDAEKRSLVLPGIALGIGRRPSPQSGAECNNPRLFVINTKRKY